MAARPCRRALAGRSGGFTLLEVLVATLIAALAALALFRADITGVTATRLSGESAAALRFARSRLAELGRSLPLIPGTRRGRLREGQRWRLRVRLAASAPGQRLYDVRLTVAWRNAGDTHRLRLETMRLAAARLGR